MESLKVEARERAKHIILRGPPPAPLVWFARTESVVKCFLVGALRCSSRPKKERRSCSIAEEGWASTGSSAKISLRRVTADQTVGCWLNWIKYLCRSPLVSMTETADLRQFHHTSEFRWLNHPGLRRIFTQSVS